MSVNFLNPQNTEKSEDANMQQGANQGRSVEERMLAAEKLHAELLHNYIDDIKWQQERLQEINKERTDYYLNTIPQISVALEEKGIPKKIREDWLKQLTDTMDRSFNLSETMIKEYYVKTAEEFRNSLQNQLDKE